MHPTLAFDSPDGQPVATTISWAPPAPALPHGHRPPHLAYPRCPPQNFTRARQTDPSASGIAASSITELTINCRTSHENSVIGIESG